MHEIFIPTTFFDGRSLCTISKNCREVFHMFEGVTERVFHCELLSGVVFEFYATIPEDIIRMCNGEFGAYYFIEGELGNKSVFSSGSALLGSGKLFESIPDISTTMDTIMRELASASLMTRTKMASIRSRIQDTLFVLSGLIYTLERLMEASHHNTQEMQQYSGDRAYEPQALLLQKVSEQKIQELQATKEILYPKLVLFLETITTII